MTHLKVCRRSIRRRDGIIIRKLIQKDEIKFILGREDFRVRFLVQDTVVLNVSVEVKCFINNLNKSVNVKINII